MRIIKLYLYFIFFILLIFGLIFIVNKLYFSVSKNKTQICENKESEMVFIPASDTLIQYTGRMNYKNPDHIAFAHSGSMITATFQGSTCYILLQSISTDTKTYSSNYFNVTFDSNSPMLIHATNDKTIYKFNQLGNGIHTIRIFKRTEAACGLCYFSGFNLEKGSKLLPSPERPKRKIEFVGNSITSGYGNEDSVKTHHFSPKTENHYLSYAAISARILNAEHHAVCYSGKGVFRNYDMGTKETLPVMYEKIYPQKKNFWKFNSWQPDVVVLNAGTNDFAQNIPPTDSFIMAFTSFLLQIRKYNPKAVIIVVDGPLLKNGLKINAETGEPEKTYSIYKQCINSAISLYKGKGYGKIYQFSLTPMGKLGYGANWHPNVKQHEYNANELAEFIKTVMEW